MGFDLENEMRCLRKSEHIKSFLKSIEIKDNYFKDVYIENNSLPELDFCEINTEIAFLNKKISFPLMINAITGGFQGALRINTELAELARVFGIPIAVGSQTAGVKDKAQRKTFRVVRDIIKAGIVISNLSARSSVEDVLSAVDMVEADAVQLHLNAAQEMCMAEGDREFMGILKNIEEIVRQVDVPVIVKEVGFGISYTVAQKLFERGVRYIDIGGKGGTNFIEIESSRNEELDFSDMAHWGIPTALSLLECRKVSRDLHLICSGGLRTAEEIVKALCIGAEMTAISGVILRELLTNGYDSAKKMLQHMIHKTKVIMLLLGKKDVESLKNVPYRLKGELRELYCQGS